MANILIEGFDLYSTGAPGVDSGMPWIRIPSNPTWTFITTSDPITGTRSCRVETGSNNTGATVYRDFTSSGTTWIMGFAVIFGNVASTNEKRVGIGNTSNNFGVWNSGGRLVCRRNGSILATGDTPLLQDVKYYVEFKITETTYEVLLDGVVELSGTMTSIGTPDRILIYSSQSSSNRGLIDDMYLNDDTGAVNNDYLGEISVVTLLPDADGSPQDWVPSTGSTAYEILDNVPPTSAYIEGMGVGDEVNVEVESVPFDINQIHVVDVVYRAAKNGSGSCEIQSQIVQDSVEGTADNTAPAEDTYAWYFNKYDLDPSTSAAWDPDTFNPSVKITRTV